MPAVTYTDDQISALVQERKPLPANWRNRARMKAKRGHDEQHLDLTGEAGTGFRLIFRQNRINGLDFSVILAVLVPQSTQVFRLRRYNGRSHQHTNAIENERFYDFHIHLATERYQANRGARRRLRPTDRSLRRLSRRTRLPVRRREFRRSTEGARRSLQPSRGRSEMTVESSNGTFATRYRRRSGSRPRAWTVSAS